MRGNSPLQRSRSRIEKQFKQRNKFKKKRKTIHHYYIPSLNGSEKKNGTYVLKLNSLNLLCKVKIIANSGM